MTQLAEIQSSLLSGKASRRYQPRGAPGPAGTPSEGFCLNQISCDFDFCEAVAR
jgi:hypothetical protein